MMKDTCFIVGAGDITFRQLQPKPNDLIIAADGGYLSLNKMGLRPDIVIGDMDSYQGRVLGVPLMRFPVRKDDTDLSLSLKLGKQLGYRRFKLYGTSGGIREDHFLAALQLMGGWSEKGYSLQLIAPNFTMYEVTSGLLLISSKPGLTVSVFSHSVRSLGVSLRGLDYEAENIKLCHGLPLGVSNTMGPTGRAAIAVRQGTLLIYVADKTDN